MHEKTLFPTSILPKTVEKTNRKSANHDKHLELEGGSRDTRGTYVLGYYVLQENVFWVWFLYRFFQVSGECPLGRGRGRENDC